MTQESKKKRGFEFLSSNTVKFIALILMSIDHAGMILFPNALWMRYLGRPALPLFAYMVAEGCCYTRDKRKYFLRLFLPGLAIQAVYTAVEKDLFFNIFITFSVSVLLCSAWDRAVEHRKGGRRFAAFACTVLPAAAVWFAVYGIKDIFHVYVGFDGGFFGILLPLAVYAVKGKARKLAILAFMCVGLAVSLPSIRGEILSVFSVIVIFFYNGKRGRLPLKFFFYIYYPLHISILYLLKAWGTWHL